MARVDGVPRGARARGRRGLAAAAGLAWLLAATPVTALAGTVTYRSADDTTHQYEAYRVLDGEFAEDGSSLTTVSYADGYDARWWESVGAPSTGAQDVADWLSAHADDDVTTRAAKALDGKEPDATFQSGEETELEDGYWLLVGSDSQPALVPVGAKTKVTLSEKSSVPTVGKEVWDGDSWERVADWGAKDAYQYRLTGTLPKNYAHFDRYHYEFVDEMDDCVVPDPSSVKACVEHQDGSTDELDDPKVDLEAVDGEQGRVRLTVTWDDLKASYPKAQDGDLVRVTYGASLTTSAHVGTTDANENDVRLRYTRSPTNDQLGETKPAECDVYAWRIRVTKVGKDSGQPLAGARFAIGRDGQWLRSDGTWATSRDDDSAAFTTGDDGTFEVPPIDEGTYELVEVGAPDGYLTETDKTEVTLKSDLSDQPALEASVKGPARLVSVDAGTGTAALELEDEPVPEAPTPQTIIRTMPKTGVGVAAGVLLAGGVAATAVALRRSRRRDTMDDHKGNGDGSER